MHNGILIFIAPPSFEELKKRLEGRQTEAPEVIQTRLDQAAREKNDSKNYDYIIVNDEVSNAVKNLEEIISQYAI